MRCPPRRTEQLGLLSEGVVFAGRCSAAGGRDSLGGMGRRRLPVVCPVAQVGGGSGGQPHRVGCILMHLHPCSRVRRAMPAVLRRTVQRRMRRKGGQGPPYLPAVLSTRTMGDAERKAGMAYLASDVFELCHRGDARL